MDGSALTQRIGALLDHLKAEESSTHLTGISPGSNAAYRVAPRTATIRTTTAATAMMMRPRRRTRRMMGRYLSVDARSRVASLKALTLYAIHEVYVAGDTLLPYENGRLPPPAGFAQGFDGGGELLGMLRSND